MPRRCRPIIVDGKVVGSAQVQVGYCSSPGCHGMEEKLCDYPVTRKGKPGTCDKKLCSKCAVRVGPNKEFEPAQAQSGGALTLKLGDRGVELWGSPLKKPRVLRGTETIRRQRAQFAARRSSRSQHQRDIGRGARGHGRARALEHFHAVDDAEQRWMRSVSQEIAAKAARTCKERGASWVTIDESLAKVIPPARMRSALEWALKKAGIAQPEKLSDGSNPAGEGGA